MSYSLKKSLIDILDGLNTDGASEKAKAEIKEAIELVKKPDVIIKDTKNHRTKVAKFFSYMFSRFKELENDENRALMHQWAGLKDEASQSEKSPGTKRTKSG